MAESDIYVKCISLQLDELEFLNSAFPITEEFRNADDSLVEEMRVYVNDNEKKGNLLPPERLFYITLAPTTAHNQAHKLEVSFELPHLYPYLEHARVLLHKPALNQSKEMIFKTQLAQYMQTLDTEEPHVYSLLTWIQDFIDKLLKRDNSDIEREVADLKAAAQVLVDFERLWIYSHHLKSSTKRQLIVTLARKLELTGFSLVGKPGIICVEGVKENTQEFWREIKALNWQKITLRKSEEKLRQAPENDANFRRFEGFKEFILSAAEDNKSSINCINMRMFVQYLSANRSAYMKQELFGIN